MATEMVEMTDQEFSNALDSADEEWFANNGRFSAEDIREFRLAVVHNVSGDDLSEAIREILGLRDLPDTDVPLLPLPVARQRAKRVSDPIALAAKRQAAYAALAHGKR